MIRNVQRTWFEVWGTEEAQNRFLKALLAFFISLCFMQAMGLLILALRKPPVIAVGPMESRVLTVIPPKAELLQAEAKRVVSGYVLAHYNWEWNRIEEAFSNASKYVDPGYVKGFLAANQEQARIAKERKVSQRFYVSDLVIDLSAKKAKVTGDRILFVEGLRAASPLSVEIQFDYGARTEANPEGMYVIAEKQASEGSQGPSAPGGS